MNPSALPCFDHTVHQYAIFHCFWIVFMFSSNSITYTDRSIGQYPCWNPVNALKGLRNLCIAIIETLGEGICRYAVRPRNHIRNRNCKCFLHHGNICFLNDSPIRIAYPITNATRTGRTDMDALFGTHRNALIRKGDEQIRIYDFR